ncbi:MAG: hypothetical protein KDI01_10065 [Halioglobus sp.]|nr:hypothetical protein [Halioglobus sp.]
MIDEFALVGSNDRIRYRLGAWKEAGDRGQVGTMPLGVHDAEVLELVAREILG